MFTTTTINPARSDTMMIDKGQLRKSLEELDRVRGELILAKYRYEEAMEDFDNVYGRGTGEKAIRTLRSRAMLKKLVLTREALDSMTEELYDTLVKQQEREE
jgi:hypothetical protein